MNTQTQSKFIPISGLWTTETQKGDTYLKGTVKEAITIPAGYSLMIFKNQYASEGPNKPSHKLSMAPPRQQQQQGQGQQQPQQQQQPAPDNIPF